MKNKTNKYSQIAIIYFIPALIFCQCINSNYVENQNLNLNNSEHSINYLPIITSSLVITGILIITDDATYELFQKGYHNSSIIRKVSPIITQMGDGKFSLGLFGTLGLYHLLTGDKKIGQTALLGFESFLLSGLTVQILKHTFGRERPSNRTEDGGEWNGPFFVHKNSSIANYDAFPSGHTTTIFAAASAISYMYPDGVVPYVSYGMATLVALSRVTESTHWLSDCFVGALIGYFSTQFITSFNSKHKSNFILGFNENTNSVSMGFSYNF